MRLLNVARGESVMLGGYAAYWGFTLWGVNPLFSALAVMPIAAAVGGLIYVT
jgi:branched-chain amino acid transport system permease protein